MIQKPSPYDKFFIPDEIRRKSKLTSHKLYSFKSYKTIIFNSEQDQKNNVDFEADPVFVSVEERSDPKNPVIRSTLASGSKILFPVIPVPTPDSSSTNPPPSDRIDSGKSNVGERRMKKSLIISLTILFVGFIGLIAAATVIVLRKNKKHSRKLKGPTKGQAECQKEAVIR